MITSDIHNLTLEVTKGETKTLTYTFGQWIPVSVPVGPVGPPWVVGYGGVLQPPLFWQTPIYPYAIIDSVPCKWQPNDITNWRFFFTMWKNPKLLNDRPPLTYNPIINQADPTTGVLLFDIADSDTRILCAGNYYFKVSCSQDLKKVYPMSGGVIGLIDNPQIAAGYNMPVNIVPPLYINTKTYVSLTLGIH